MLICILGRQPEIGTAELISVFGSNKVSSLGNAAIVEVDNLDQTKLGGVTKTLRPIQTLDNPSQLQGFLKQYFEDQSKELESGKFTIGLSTYTNLVRPSRLLALGLEIKKACRANDRPVRIVPTKTSEISSAQILHNKLNSSSGYDICFVEHKNKLVAARTEQIQDIESYSHRDFDRPKRDAFVGMLPPKLAQIMVNLACQGQKSTVLDPFCGTGVVLQEALLMGHNCIGSDLSEKMVEYSSVNLEWAKNELGTTANFSVEQGDATDHQWQSFNHVVCETYLGTPLSHPPRPEKLKEIISNCNVIITKFLRNLHAQANNGSRHCIAVPAWSINNKFIHLPLIDQLENLGYNVVKFDGISSNDLIYHRENQIVARELLVLKVK